MNEHRVRPAAPTRPACLGLGSNDDPAGHLPRALDALRRSPGIAVVAASRAWESPAVGPPGPNYLNAALLVRTTLGRDELRAWLKRVERDLGRDRAGGPSSPVTIDIDLLSFDGEPLDASAWDLAYRGLPLAELFPDLASPATGETLAGAALRLSRSVAIKPRPDVLPGAAVRSGQEAVPF